ncbi:hypothetical protein CCR75_008473 [Bremia lactucae]|uniref:Uncharacterized protein n=1 Tax=Bremia lactucae TaxID=4779 RepID=A0A976IIY3_BRELC|nr:hypothetical protein CCR75_008473 [Bremia lactucae]
MLVRPPMDHLRTPDTHDQTLRATRVRKIPETVSSAVAAAAVAERTNQTAANTTAIRARVIQHKAVAALSSQLPVGPKGQTVWVNACALDLAALFSNLPYPVVYLASMQGEILRAFGHAINSKTRLAVIRRHTTHADAKLRAMCTGWAATANG